MRSVENLDISLQSIDDQMSNDMMRMLLFDANWGGPFMGGMDQARSFRRVNWQSTYGTWTLDEAVKAYISLKSIL